MASLALLVSLIFLTVIFSGPIVFILSKYSVLPKTIIQLLSLLTIILGLWWFTITIMPVNFMGLLTAYFGWRAIQNSRIDA